jgi:hypothetical protein
MQYVLRIKLQLIHVFILNSFNFNQQMPTIVIRFTIIFLKTLNAYVFLTIIREYINYLMFTGPCIANIFQYVSNKMKL